MAVFELLKPKSTPTECKLNLEIREQSFLSCFLN